MKSSDLHGVLASLVAHALLFVFFWFTESKQEVTEQLGYIEVDFGEFSEGRAVQNAPENQPLTEQPEIQPEVQEEPQPAEPEEAKPVDLPDASQVDTEPPVDVPETDIEAVNPQDPEDEQQVENDPVEEVEPIRPLGSGSTDGRTGAEDGDQGEGNDEQEAAPFQIEGLNRTPLKTPPPAYASQVTADIIVKIWVGPNGRVARQLVLRKGDPRLEEAVALALRNWRFNPLPPNVPQDLQEGTVTFRFRLE